MAFDENGNWIPQDPADAWVPDKEYGVGYSGLGSGLSLIDLLNPLPQSREDLFSELQRDYPNDPRFAPDYDPMKQEPNISMDRGVGNTPPPQETPAPQIQTVAPQGQAPVRPELNSWEQMLGGLQFYPDADENTRQMALNEARHALGKTLIAAGLAPDARHRALAYAQMLDKSRQAYRSTLDFGDRQAKEAKNEAWQEEARTHQRKNWENEEWRQKTLKDAFDNSHENAPAEVAENTKLLEDSIQKAVKDGRMSEQEANGARAAMGALSKKYLSDPTDMGIYSSMYKILSDVTTKAGTTQDLINKAADDLYSMSLRTGMSIDDTMEIARQAALLPGMEWALRKQLVGYQLRDAQRQEAGIAALQASGGAMPMPGTDKGMFVLGPDGRILQVLNPEGASGVDKAANRKFLFNVDVQRIAVQPDARMDSDTANLISTMMMYQPGIDILEVPGSPGQWMLSPEKQKEFGAAYREAGKNFADTGRPAGNPSRGNPSPTGSPVSMAEIRRVAKEKGVSEQEAIQNALANGHPVVP